MSYDRDFLFQRIISFMSKAPCLSIQNISKELQVSRRTVQSVIRQSAGKTYSALRREILLSKTIELFSTQPALAVKQVSFAVGFASPQSFARAIKRASGFSPECLRSRVLADCGSRLSATCASDGPARKFPD